MFKRKRGGQEVHDANWVHPPCDTCGGPVPRRTYEDGRLERMSAWVGRRGCSEACSRGIAARRGAEAAQALADKAVREHDPCDVCGKPVPLEEGVNLRVYRKRRTCSEACRKDFQSISAAEAHEARRQSNAAPPRTKIRLDPKRGFVGDFGAYDVREKPVYGRIGATPEARTYGGVVSYGS